MEGSRDRPLFARLRLSIVAGGLIAGGTLVLSLAGPHGRELAHPGPLSGAHAPLAERCDACHLSGTAAVQSVLSGWVASAVDLEQSARCLACHDLGPDPFGPHGWSFAAAEERREASAAFADHGPLERSADVPFSSAGELACATCHHEHRGRDHALTRLADRRCQACHLERFDHFADGHPELSASYPYDRRTNLIFDHELHFERHFRDEGEGLAPVSCTDCHELDEGRGSMLLRGYAETCAACHDADIAGRTQLDGSGIAFLAFPALDLPVLEEAEPGIGAWPADALEVETPLTPFLAFLLSTDRQAAQDLATWNELDALDLADASEEELAAVARLAWRTKELFQRLSEEGHPALWDAIERRLGRPLTAAEQSALLAGLPAELWQSAISAWHHELGGELERRAEGKSPPTSLAPTIVRIEEDPRRERWVAGGGWYLRDSDFSVRYRPRGHADPFLATWLDIAAESAPALFEHLAEEEGPGRCTKCHAVEEEQGRARVRWQAVPYGGRLTRFHHGPHLISDDARSCVGCHALGERSEDYARSFEDRDPHTFTSGFEPIPRSTCVRCHAPQTVPSGCIDCHGYHAHAPRAARGPAALSELFGESSPGN